MLGERKGRGGLWLVAPTHTFPPLRQHSHALPSPIQSDTARFRWGSGHTGCPATAVTRVAHGGLTALRSSRGWRPAGRDPGLPTEGVQLVAVPAVLSQHRPWAPFPVELSSRLHTLAARPGLQVDRSLRTHCVIHAPCGPAPEGSWSCFGK